MAKKSYLNILVFIVWLLTGCRNEVFLSNAEFLPKALVHSCFKRPDKVIGDIEPEEMWHWEGNVPQGYSITYSSPVAGDLDRNGVVEIVSIASSKNYTTDNGPIVVINGRTGNVIWNSLVDSNFGGKVSTTPAIADLDKDGVSEIIVTAFQYPATTNLKSEILIIDYATKNIRKKFSHENFSCGSYCMVAVADLNGNGNAEIIAGNVILDHNGDLITFLPDSQPKFAPTVADLIPEQPGLEIIIGGSQVYNIKGELLWKGTCFGFSAVADLDHDGSPELVCTSNGMVYIYEKDGTLKSQASLPADGDRNQGGAPNIGNFYGDKNLEIGIAGGYYYVVFDKDLNIKWKKNTQDTSSSSTGSTIFDLNGDGKVEVIYNDELMLRIYDGETGDVLWETENPSGTLWEYPLIVNLDDHPSAEIVVSAPNLGGIRAFRDPTKRWVEARNIWNQYSYYPEIVRDNLTVTSNPGIPSGFRINSQGSLAIDNEIIYLPDLTIVLNPNIISTDKKNNYKKEVFVLNIGQADMPAGATLKLIDQVSLSTINEIIIDQVIGSGKQISFELGPLFFNNTYSLSVNLDSTGSTFIEECVSSNNRIDF